MRNTNFRLKSEDELYDEILTNIVRYKFNYEFTEDAVNIYWRNSVTMTYRFTGLSEKFFNYLKRRFG